MRNDRTHLTNINNIHWHRDTNRGATNPVTVDALLQLLEGQHWRCRFCHDSIRENYWLDHKVSIKRGGAHSIENIQFTCPRCNRSKGGRWKSPHPRSIRAPLSFLEMTPRDIELLNIYEEAHTDDGTSFDLTPKPSIKPEANTEYEDDGSAFVLPIRTLAYESDIVQRR
jgi:hypothetical protein